MRTPLLPALTILLSLGLTVSAADAQTGAYTVDGSTAIQTDQTYVGTLTDQSAVYVLNSGHLTLTNCTMTKSGDASSTSNSSQYGTNAGVLAASAGVVTITGGSVTTNASGGNGLFATGSGSAITMTGGTINASGDGAHGVDVTYGGSITLTNVDITTTGASSSALATDFGGGRVTVTGGTITAANTASGGHSAGIYSTGIIGVTGATVSSLGDCGGVIDGANNIYLVNTSLTGALHGIKIWKTAPMSGTATVNMVGGTLAATNGDAFYVTAETGNAAMASISLAGGATITAGTGNILSVLGSSTATFSVSGVTLNGRFHSDTPGATTVNLRDGSTLTGAANGVVLTLDAGSVWTVTSNSILTGLIDPEGISGTTIANIIGNGHDVHYDSALAVNSYLGGRIYPLINGGVLTPDVVPASMMSWGTIKARFRDQ
jgi:hypothetical protein